MYKLCKTEESSRRQRAIERHLLTVMTVKNFDDISVIDICDGMNMPRKAFYRYFDNKEGALHALIDHTLLDFERFNEEYAASRPKPKGRRVLKDELERFFIFWMLPEKKALLDGLERSNLTGLLIQSSVDFSNSSFVNPAKFLPNESEWMRTELFQFAICGLMSITLSWYRGGFAESTSDMAAAAARMFARPLFPDLERFGIE